MDSGDILVTRSGAMTVIEGALTASRELTAAGHAALREYGLISESRSGEEADACFPPLYSRWEAERILAVLQPHYATPDEGSHLLEVGAGQGRLALHMLKAGHRLDAVDIAEEALDRLWCKAAGDGLSARLSTFVADAANFARPDHYAFAYCAANSLRRLGSRSRVQRHLRLIHRSLRTGGAYLVHVGLSTHPGSASWLGADGRRVDWTVEESDPRTSETIERMRMTGTGSPAGPYAVRVQVLLHGADLAAMARAAGFGIGALWEEDFTRARVNELASAKGNVWVLLQRR